MLKKATSRCRCLQVYWLTVICNVCRYLVWLGSNRQAMGDRALVMHTDRPDAQAHTLAALSQQHGSIPPWNLTCGAVCVIKIDAPLDEVMSILA